MTRTIDVAGVGYQRAYQRLRDANQLAALTHTRMADRLSGCGAMAGDSSFAEPFAASYDDAALAAVRAFEGAVAALASLSRVTAACLDNHICAELASTLTEVALDVEPSLAGIDLYTVERYVPPPSLGGDPSSLPGWANMILDHIEGFVWPDADLDRLQEAARIWRALAAHLHDLVGSCDGVIADLYTELSPETPVAAQTVADLKATILDLESQATSLADACDDYAEAVQAQRDAILDLVHDLIRDAILIQAGGLLLGALTAGAAAGGALALNAAKIAAESPKFWRFIETLRLYALDASLALKSGAATSASIEVRLERFVQSPTLIRAEVAPMNAGRRYSRGWLRLHEIDGSHTLARHVGKTDDWLRARLSQYPGLPYASTFRDQEAAERAIEDVLGLRRAEIRAWLSGGKSSERFEARFNDVVGRSVDRAGHAQDVRGVRVILKRDATMPHGFRVFTAFPQP